MSNLIINVDEYENACCGTCKHNKECDSCKHNDWICGLYENGGRAIEQLSLFDFIDWGESE